MVRISRSEQTPHLAPALTAVILGVVVLEAFGFYARSLESRSITALAADEAIIERDGKLAPVKNQGTALQQAALDTGCLLPVYGSSELNLHSGLQSAVSSDQRVPRSPHGVHDLPGGQGGNDLPDHPAKAGRGRPRAAGAESGDLRCRLSGFSRGSRPGRTATPAISPPCTPENWPSIPGLSLQLRQDAARRMLQYPETVANRPLLRFALENLADGSPFSLACYDAVLPLGIVHNAILRYQDHWSVVCYLWKHPARDLVPDFAARRPAAGLADVAPAGGRIVPRSFRQQRVRAG